MRIIVHDRIVCMTIEQFAMCMVMKANGMRYKAIAGVMGLSYHAIARAFYRAQKFGFEVFNSKVVEVK